MHFDFTAPKALKSTLSYKNNIERRARKGRYEGGGK